MNTRRFRIPGASAFGILLVSSLVVTGCAQNFVPYPNPAFHVQFEQGKDRHGAPRVSGYVYNDYGSPVENVELLIEAIDESEQVVARRIVRLPGSISALGRAYFDVAAPSAAARYRVSVYGFPTALRGV